MSRIGAFGVLTAVAASIAACGSGSSGSPGSSPDGGSPQAGSPVLPPAGGQFDYQIGGAYAPAASVAVVDRDWHDSPVAGKYNVCYVNAFQTQPEENPWWRTNHPDLLLTENGVEVSDPNWPGEIVLDISTAEKRAAIAEIVGGWMDACAAKGFLGVEPDNLDTWDRNDTTRRLLTKEDNAALAKLLAARAHAAGLAIAQKNVSELAPLHAEIGFDFAIVEECQPWGDCDDFTAAYGSRWYEIEYDDNDPSYFQAACAARGDEISVIYRDRQVTAAGKTGYVYQTCPAR